MRFQPVKCNMMQLTNKTLNKIQASYTLEGTVLENVDNIKYLGVTITNDLKWNTHISNSCTKANRTLGFLRRTLFSCPQNVKEAAYKGMVRPILEYGSSVWDGSVLLPQDTPRHPRTTQDALLYLKDTSKYHCLFIFIIILLILKFIFIKKHQIIEYYTWNIQFQYTVRKVLSQNE